MDLGDFWDPPEGPNQGQGGPRGWRRMPHRHRGRMRRGFMKVLLMKMLAGGERHGYDFLKELREKGWTVAGSSSIYPTLQWLEEQGFVQSREEDGKRTYTMTDHGKEFLHEQADHFKEHIQHVMGHDDSDEAREREASPLRDEAQKLFGALKQAARDGNPATSERIIELLKNLRKEIYTLLANE